MRTLSPFGSPAKAQLHWRWNWNFQTDLALASVDLSVSRSAVPQRCTVWTQLWALYLHTLKGEWTSGCRSCATLAALPFSSRTLTLCLLGLLQCAPECHDMLLSIHKLISWGSDTEEINLTIGPKFFNNIENGQLGSKKFNIVINIILVMILVDVGQCWFQIFIMILIMILVKIDRGDPVEFLWRSCAVPVEFRTLSRSCGVPVEFRILWTSCGV